jgi:hypothetical protein
MTFYPLRFFPALDEDNFSYHQGWYLGEDFFVDNREYWPDAYLMYVAM